MRLMAQLAGDVPDMALEELKATFEAHGAPLSILRQAPRYVDAHSDVFEHEVRPILSRLGLVHVVAMYLFEGRPGHWPTEARECCFPTGLSFACRTVRIDANAPWSGPSVEREVGEILYTASRPVDLKSPQQLVRTFLLDDRVVVGQQLWESEPKALAERHVDHRPFSSPVSLQPRLARALVNLARIAPGQTLWDPFCGTGGILLEAASMGVKAIGSDLDPEMVEGTMLNLAHFGLPGRCFVSDVAHGPDGLAGHGARRVDAVVSDLPYGRSSTLGREAPQRLYVRALRTIESVLKPGGYAVLGLPDPAPVQSGFGALDLRALFRVRAHKSLTRHFAVLQKSETV